MSYPEQLLEGCLSIAIIYVYYRNIVVNSMSYPGKLLEGCLSIAIIYVDYR